MAATRKSPNPVRRKHNVHAARQMRHEPTSTEEIVWQRLRNRQVGDAKFRRQHSIDRFIVDFYCAEARLVVEIDGAIHDQPNADAERQAALEALGLRVLRFSDAEARREINSVIEAIHDALTGENSPKTPLP